MESRLLLRYIRRIVDALTESVDIKCCEQLLEIVLLWNTSPLTRSTGLGSVYIPHIERYTWRTVAKFTPGKVGFNEVACYMLLSAMPR